jgi:dTDP-4-amino-4,6-dideoxygalactose transaminase
MAKLALLGGEKTIRHPFERYNSIGHEEETAVNAVMKSGVLSKFLGCWDPDFYGGEKVQELERRWEEYFKVKHAISVNSNTSGLIAAVGAIGIEPGDEVIVSPWTMSASATAILVWNAIPVFADIEIETFNLDPKKVEQLITPRTKAIMVTDIFGHAALLDELMTLANKHGLKVIEDCAQAPGALYKGRYVGTVADIGVFSLNYHKHIHTGEGGICVTNDQRLAERLQLIRNHGEVVIGEKEVADPANIIGFNFRLTEIQAAIGIEQLKKLQRLVKERIQAAERLSAGLQDLKGLTIPTVMPNCTHVYYDYPLIVDPKTLGYERAMLHKALVAEGVENLGQGYQVIYRLPLYQKRIAYGKKGFPWSPNIYNGQVSYSKGICPTTEKLHDETFMGMEMCVSKYTNQEIDLVIKAFQKVWQNLEELKGLNKRETLS